MEVTLNYRNLKASSTRSYPCPLENKMKYSIRPARKLIAVSLFLLFCLLAATTSHNEERECVITRTATKRFGNSKLQQFSCSQLMTMFSGKQ